MFIFADNRISSDTHIVGFVYNKGHYGWQAIIYTVVWLKYIEIRNLRLSCVLVYIRTYIATVWFIE